MEIDGDLEIVRIAIATGALLNGSDLGVQPFGDGVGYAMREIGEDIRQMPLDQLCNVDHGRQAAVRRPEIPTLPELGRPCRRGVAPQFPQRLLDGPRPTSLEFGAFEFIESSARLVGHVLRVGQPQILALGQSGISCRHQRFVLLLSDLVHRINHVPHDVEAVEHHLAVGIGNLVLAGADVSRPHVQADRLDVLPLILRKCLEVGGKTRFLAVLADVLDCRFFQITDESHVAVALSDRPLVDADLPGNGILLRVSATQDGALHQVPGFIPGDAQEPRRLLDVRCQKDVDGQRLEQIRESATRLRPRQSHLMHAMLRARHARRSRMQVGE